MCISCDADGRKPTAMACLRSRSITAGLPANAAISPSLGCYGAVSYNVGPTVPISATMAYQTSSMTGSELSTLPVAHMAAVGASPTCSEVCRSVSLWSCGSIEAGLSLPSTTHGMADVPNRAADVPCLTTKAGEEIVTRCSNAVVVPSSQITTTEAVVTTVGMVSRVGPTSSASCADRVRFAAVGRGITGVSKGISTAALASTPAPKAKGGKNRIMAFFSRVPSDFGVVFVTITCFYPCYVASYGPDLVAISPIDVRKRPNPTVIAMGFGFDVSMAKSPSTCLSARLSRSRFGRYAFGALAFSISGFSRLTAVPAWSQAASTPVVEVAFSAGCSRFISAATFRAAKTGLPILPTFMGICPVSRINDATTCMGFPTLGYESVVSCGCGGITTGISSFMATCASAALAMAQEQSAIAGF